MIPNKHSRTFKQTFTKTHFSAVVGDDAKTSQDPCGNAMRMAVQVKPKFVHSHTTTSTTSKSTTKKSKITSTAITSTKAKKVVTTPTTTTKKKTAKTTTTPLTSKTFGERLFTNHKFLSFFPSDRYYKVYYNLMKESRTPK